MVELKFSSLAATDLNEIFELNKITGSTDWSFELFEAELTAPSRINLVARSDHGQLVGFVMSSYVLEELTVLAIAVNPTVQRNGVAKALFDELVKRARAVRCLRAFLEVRRSNLAARAFYRSCGFEEAGIRPGYYPEPLLEDAIQLSVDLPNGS